MNTIKRLLRWVWQLRHLPKIVTVPSVLVLAGLLSFGAYKGMTAYDYMQDNPNFCRSCHTMEQAWSRWYTSEHRSLSCHSCHETTIVQGAEQLILFSLNQPERVSKHALVNDEACQKCHESGNPRWKQVAATVGHRVHNEEQNIACMKCHSVSIHRFRASAKVCAVCHEEKTVEVAAMANFHCASCHSYLAKNDSLVPHRETCLACHQAQKVQKVTWPEAAPMKADCQQCHNPHQKSEPLANCLTCHKDIKGNGLHRRPTHQAATCTTCHQPHEWVVKNRDSCLVCHADKVQHNPGVNCDTCHKFKGGV